VDLTRSEFLQATGAAIAAAGLPAASGGRTLLVPFSSAPYPHGSRLQGHVYQGRLYDAATHYMNSNTGIFIPDGWQVRNGAVDFIVHFYGWNHDIAATFSTYRLREQLVASKRNAILVVPEGPTNAPDSGFGKLELDKGGFRRFMTDVAAKLKELRFSSTDNIGRVVLTAHSGGYGGAGGALTRGDMNDSVSDVLLFDAAYGYFDAFADWARVPQHHLLSLFTGDTSTGNAALMGKLQAPTPNLYVRLADSMTLEQLQTRAPTFVLTSVAHDDLLQKYSWYSLFLQTTALDAIA